MMEDNQERINLEALSKRIEEVKNTDISGLETKEQKVVKLVKLLHSIEKETTKLETILHSLWETGRESNNSLLMYKAAEKLKLVEGLRIKIQRARLNLNWFFISK